MHGYSLTQLSVQLKELDFIIFQLKNDHEATVFQTWHKGQQISRMLKSSAYQNPGDGALLVLELFQKNRKNCRFDPY